MAVKGELGFLDHFDRIISERDEDIDIGQLGSGNYEALMLAALDAFRAAPPAPISVPTFDEWLEIRGNKPLGWVKDAMRESYDACRAAMLQGADTELQRKAAIHDALCEKYNVESLADFVEWQRNHIAELEAAPPAPVGEGETAVMPDYPGYVMTQRECFQAGKKRAVPDGYVVVPVELTQNMRAAWDSAPNTDDDDHNMQAAYRAMIAAAPQQEVKP